LTSAIAAFFYLRVIIRMFMTEPEGEPAPELNRGLTIDIVVAAIGTIAIGLIPAPVFALVEQSMVALGG